VAVSLSSLLSSLLPLPLLQAASSKNGITIML
jgi:hypothetical protein